MVIVSEQKAAISLNSGIVRNCDTDMLKAQLMEPVHELVKLGYKFGADWFENQLESAFDMAWSSIRNFFYKNE